MYFIKTSAIRIPTSLSNHEWYQNIISDLTRKERDYNNPTVEVSKTFFDIRDGMMLLPRNYNVQISGHDIIDCNSSGEDIKIEFKSSFKNDLQKEAHNGMINSESCVLCMQPGEGKTVIATKFKDASAFVEGLAPVKFSEEEKYGYIDPKGNFVIEPQFNSAGAFVDGLAPASVVSIV